jgi:hypothetical protein
MYSSCNTKRAIRTVVAGAVVLIGTVAGFTTGPPIVADTAETGGWYVIVDENGNAVAPEHVAAGVTETESGSWGYPIVGEGGVTYIPEQVGGGATEAASEAPAEVGWYVAVGEGGEVYVPEWAGMVA